MILIRILVVLFGFLIVANTGMAAIKVFVLPRSANVFLSRIVFLTMDSLFRFITRRLNSYEEQDRVMALYAPLSLLVVVFFWMILIVLGYSMIYWGLGRYSWPEALTLSGSSLLTLGFATADNLLQTLLVFSEATIGLGLVALLVAYLPTMYTAFAQRETEVTLLEVRAGSPPTAVEWIARAHRLNWLANVGEKFVEWENWFAEIEESHTSLAALVFFRSPRPERSWVTAAGAVLDTASLMASTVDVPRDVRAELCIRAGYIALRHIADFFEVPYNANPAPDEPISISREEYDAACDSLARAGVPLKADREQAWRDFAGWRVNYDTVLLALAALTMAPYAPWSSDRSLLHRRSLMRRLKR